MNSIPETIGDFKPYAKLLPADERRHKSVSPLIKDGKIPPLKELKAAVREFGLTHTLRRFDRPALEQVARNWRSRSNKRPPDRFRQSRAAEKRKTSANKWTDLETWRADTELELVLYTFRLDTIGLAHLEHSSNVYDPVSVQTIKSKVQQLFNGDPHIGKFEIGKDEILHCHVVGPKQVNSILPLNTSPEATKDIYDFVGAVKYVSKEVSVSHLRLEGEYIMAQILRPATTEFRLPSTTWRLNLPETPKHFR